MFTGDAVQPSQPLPFPFPSALFQSFPASESFPKSPLFTSGGQSIEASASCIHPSNEYSGLISFRTDWLELFAAQGTLKSFLQHHRLKASVFWCSAFFMVQFSHPYVTTGKTIAIWLYGPLLALWLYGPLLAK